MMEIGFIYSFMGKVGTILFLLCSLITCGNTCPALGTDEKANRRDSTRKMMIFTEASNTQCPPGTTKSQPACAESQMFVGLRMCRGWEMGLLGVLPSWTVSTQGLGKATLLQSGRRGSLVSLYL